MKLSIEFDREEDGRWIAEVLELPGVLVYGADQAEALANVKALAFECLAGQIKHGEIAADLDAVAFEVLADAAAAV